MIKVHSKDGITRSYDLSESDQLVKWQGVSSDIKFQSEITGIGILFNSQWFSLPLPKKFRQYYFKADLVESKKNNGPTHKGERVQCFADDILISLVVYWGFTPKMSRIDVIRIGKRRFNPEIKAG